MAQMPLLDETKIKAAIGHDEPEVRERALQYFGDHAPNDPTVMPLVIEAIDRLGLDRAWRMLLSARPLRQTPATLAWVFDQLNRPFDLDDVAQDNRHYALTWLLVEADPGLLGERYEQVVAVPGLPERLRQVLDERLELHRASWAECWAQLEAFGRALMDLEVMNVEHHQRAGRLIAALAHHGRGRRDAEQFVLNLVRRQYPKAKRELYGFLESEVTRLAGRMQLTQAVPVLVRRLVEEEDEDEDLSLADARTLALKAIGTDAVANPVAAAWWQASEPVRVSLAELLGDIRSELAAERCMTFFKQEQDEAVLQTLAHAMLRQFNTDAVGPLADLVADDRLLEHDVEWRDVRLALVEAATIMGVGFHEYDNWYQQAREAPWGWRRRVPEHRLREGVAGFLQAIQRETADDLEAMPDAPDTLWRLKVTLGSIDPPVWRRLEVPDCPLDELHIILQIAFGWDDAHLYSFHAHGVAYGDPDLFGDEPPDGDATETWLSDVVHEAGGRLTYVYDLGDHWEHEIVIEQVQQTDDPYIPPRCVAGERACPPEDVGGPPGYEAYLAALADPQHEDHEQMRDWNGAFDPEAFDREAVNAELREGFEAWEAEVSREIDAIGFETEWPDEADEDDLDLSPLALSLLDDREPRYPVGTLARYGPDATTTTKLVAGVIHRPGTEPLLERWVGVGILENARVQQEIQAFFRKHNVSKVTATDANIGCPHEAGADFPEGGDCPFCPYWQGKQ